jgi:hypothetical protein
MPPKRRVQETPVPEEAEDVGADASHYSAAREGDVPCEAASGFGELLATRIVDRFDLATLAARLAPELSDRFASEIQIEALRIRVLELLAANLADDEVLVAAVVSKLTELL